MKGRRAWNAEATAWGERKISRPSRRPSLRGHPGAARFLRMVVSVAFLLACIGQASAVEVTSPEGELYAFPLLLDADGRPVARSTLSQWFEDGLLHVRVTHAFADGREAVERARFEQGAELVQQWWSWEERRGDAVLRSFEADLLTGRTRARKREDGREKTWDENLSVERGGTFAGIGVPYAVKNLSGRVLRGEDVSIHGISFLPKPASVRLTVTHAAREWIDVAGRRVDADRFEVRLSRTLLTAVLELFKDIPGAEIWLHHGRPPMILRVRYPLVEPWDPVVVVETLGR